MKKIIAILILVFTSCASLPDSVPLKFRDYSQPENNQTQTKELGERLILKGEEYYQEAYQITQDSKTDFSINMAKFPHPPGTVLPLKGSTREWLLYYPNEMAGTYGYYMMGVAKLKKNHAIIKPFVSSTSGLATKKVENFNVIETTYTNSDCKKCFKQELIYNGKVGNNMKFIYREYIENLARPAFTQELQYDLSESSIVGFKGARLEIEKATNTSITYKVISNFQQL